MEWEQAAQSWGTMLLDRWSASEFTPAPSTMNAVQVGPTGTAYIEGKPATLGASGGFSLSMPVILAGVGILAAVLLLRKG